MKKIGRGVIISDIRQNQYLDNRKMNLIIRVVLVYIGIFGNVYSLLSCFSFSYNKIILNIVLLLGTGIMFLIFKKTFHPFKILIGSFILIEVIVIISLNTIQNEGKVILNVILEGNAAQESTSCLLLPLLLGMVSIVVLVYEDRVAKNVVATITIMFVYIGIGILFNKVPSLIALALCGGYIASVMARRDANFERKNSFVAGGAACILVLVTVLLTTFLIPKEKFVHLSIFDSLRTMIEATYDRYANDGIETGKASGGINGGQLGQFDSIEYENRSMLTYETGAMGTVYLRGFIGTTYVNNHWIEEKDDDLSKYKSLFQYLSDNHIELANQTSELFKIIDSDEELMKSTVYTESTSENSRNSEDDKNSVDDRNSVDDTNSVDNENRVDDTNSVDNKNNKDEKKIVSKQYLSSVLRRNFKIEYTGDSGKYWYTPYGNLSVASNKSGKDGSLLNPERSTISSLAYICYNENYEIYKELVDQYTGTNRIFEKYIECEKKYRRFVYDEYTKGDSTAVRAILKELGTVTNTYDGKQKFIADLKQYFQNNFEYTTSPGKTPKGKDFISYFLNESKSGYCTYFASAAVAALRAAGIPSRYVEGYRVDVKSDDYTENVSSQRISSIFNYTENYNQYKVDVLDNNAHAWVEIYQDGYGWIPVDFTPADNLNQSSIQQSIQQSDYTANQQSDLGQSDQQASVLSKIQQMQQMNRGKLTENVVENNTSASSQENEESIIQQEEEDDNEAYDSIQDYVKKTNNNHIEPATLFGIIVRKVVPIIRVIFYLLIVMVLFVICFTIPVMIIAVRNARMFAGGRKLGDEQELNIENQMQQMYHYLVKLCMFGGVRKTDSMSYKELVHIAKQKDEALNKSQIDKVIDCILMMRFAKDYSEKEVREASIALKTVKSGVFSHANYKRKLLFLYWYHLY